MSNFTETVFAIAMPFVFICVGYLAYAGLNNKHMTSLKSLVSGLVKLSLSSCPPRVALWHKNLPSVKNNTWPRLLRSTAASFVARCTRGHHFCLYFIINIKTNFMHFIFLVCVSLKRKRNEVKVSNSSLHCKKCWFSFKSPRRLAGIFQILLVHGIHLPRKLRSQ